MTPKLSPKAESLLNDRWQLTPARMAEHLCPDRFQRFQHIKYLDRQITQATARGGARIVISMPPRHGKSFLTSLFTPAWFLSLWPNRNVILASYEATFAATWGRQVRNFLQEHRGALGVSLADDSQAADRWNTSKGGGMITAGIGGPITGRGGHLLLIDDPVKNWEEAASELIRQKHIDWFNSTLYTRAEPGASIIVLMTRWHERDLAGYLLNEHQDDWQEIRLPALAEDGDPLGRMPGDALCPERYSVDNLKQIQAAIGSRMWNALYQQRPAPEEGSLFKRSWIRHYREIPSDLDAVCLAADLTFKGGENSDFVALQVWGRKGANKYFLDQVRARMSFTESLAALRGLAAKWPEAHAKYVEDAANGAALVDTLRNHVPGLISVKPTGSKLARAQAVSPQWEAGNVYLPDPMTSPWIGDYIEELISFPNARNDDQVDASSLALSKLTETTHNYDWLPVSILKEPEYRRSSFG